MPYDLSGKELHVGDVVKVWWQPGTDTVLALSEYRTNPPPGLPPHRFATFACLPSQQMTVFDSDAFVALSLGPRPRRTP